MRVFGVIGIVMSVLFIISLLTAIASNGGISKEEFAPVAYLFGVFAAIMCAAAARSGRVPAKFASAVLGLGLVYLALYSIEWAVSEKQSYRKRYESRSYRVKTDDLNVAAGIALSIGALATGSWLARKRPQRAASSAGTASAAV
jgi:hypothetical protein